MFWNKKTQIHPVIIEITHSGISVLRYEFDIEVGNIKLQYLAQHSLPVDIISYTGISNITFIKKIIEESLVQMGIAESNQHEYIVGISGLFNQVQIGSYQLNRSHPNRSLSESEWNNHLYEEGLSIIKESLLTPIDYNVFPQDIMFGYYDQIMIDDIPLLESDHTPLKGNVLKTHYSLWYGPSEYLYQIHTLLPNITIISGEYAVAKLILDNHQNPYIELILIDIEYKHTTISLIKNKAIIEQYSFGIGMDDLVQKISSDFDITVQESRVLLQEYSSHQLPKDISDNIAKTLSEALEVWINGVVVTVKQIQKVPLPEHIVLYGPGASILGVKECLEYQSWYKEFSFVQKPIVSTLNPKMLPHIVNETHDSLGSEHISLIGLAHLAGVLTMEKFKKHIVF